MSDDELEKIRLRKVESILKAQAMPKEVIKVGSFEEYDQLLENHPDKVIIIDFWAVWCGPCLMFAPVFENLQQQYGHEFIFIKVNVDQLGSIAQRYRITGIPTTLFIKNKKIIHKIVGVVNADYMRRILEKLKSFSK